MKFSSSNIEIKESRNMSQAFQIVYHDGKVYQLALVNPITGQYTPITSEEERSSELVSRSWKSDNQKC